MKKYSQNFITNNSHLFYKLPNGNYYPYLKEDINFIIDNYNPFTYIPILEDMDVPYIKKEWDMLVEKYQNNIIIGKYIGHMSLCAYKPFKHEDSKLFTSQGTSSLFYPIKNFKIGDII